jgi:hypothetical protein
MLGNRAAFGVSGAVGEAAQEYDQEVKGASEILQVYKYILSTFVQLKTDTKGNTMNNKANLTEVLAETGGNARHKKTAQEQPGLHRGKMRSPKGRHSHFQMNRPPKDL